MKEKKNRLPILLAALLVLAAGVIAVQHRVLTFWAERACRQGLEDAQAETIEVTDEITVDNATLKELVAPAGKMITSEYYYTDVGTYEKSQRVLQDRIVLPFSTDKTLYTYSGVIGAGIEMEEITFAVREAEKQIIIHYPEPKIVSHEMGKEFAFYDVKKAVFSPSSFNDYEEFRARLKVEQEEKLMANEAFWDSVRENAERLTESLMTASGQISDYTLFHRW